MIIVVEGNIGAGKSTLLGAIGEYIASRVGQERVAVIAEPVSEWCKNDLLKRFYEDRAGNGLQLQLTVALSMIENERLAEDLSSRSKFVVMERSMMSAQRVFGEIFTRGSSVSESDKRLFRSITKRYQPRITADRLGCKNYLRLYVRTPVEECMRRIRQRGRDGEEHITGGYLRDVETNVERLVLSDGDHDTRHTVVLDGSYDEKNPMSAVVKVNSDSTETRSLQTLLQDICCK